MNKSIVLSGETLQSIGRDLFDRDRYDFRITFPETGGEVRFRERNYHFYAGFVPGESQRENFARIVQDGSQVRGQEQWDYTSETKQETTIYCIHDGRLLDNMTASEKRTCRGYDRLLFRVQQLLNSYLNNCKK